MQPDIKDWRSRAWTREATEKPAAREPRYERAEAAGSSWTRALFIVFLAAAVLGPVVALWALSIPCTHLACLAPGLMFITAFTVAGVGARGALVTGLVLQSLRRQRRRGE